MDQRKKGTKRSFFINVSQEQPGFREPRKVEVGGKRLRQPPMECWGCKGNHMYRYFPHRNDKVRVVHNVQQEETVKDMDRSVPRIYAAMDKNQEKY
jgi:hypothetical protein